MASHFGKVHAPALAAESAATFRKAGKDAASAFRNAAGRSRSECRHDELAESSGPGSQVSLGRSLSPISSGSAVETEPPEVSQQGSRQVSQPLYQQVRQQALQTEEHKDAPQVPGTMVDLPILTECAKVLLDKFGTANKAFAAIDNNTNGRICLNEFTNGISKHWGGDAQAVFKAIDTNKQGDISLEEFKVLDQIYNGSIYERGELEKVLEVYSNSNSSDEGEVKPLERSYVGKSGGECFFRHHGNRPASSTSEDDEQTIVEFVRWAKSQWATLHTLFKELDATGKYVVSRPLNSREFAERIYWHGFKGDATRVFHEILQMGRGRFFTRGANGTVSLAQINQLIRRGYSIYGPPEPTTAERFVHSLRHRRGSLLRCWRIDIDRAGSGLVAFPEFVQSCRLLGYGSQANRMWHQLRSYRPDGPLSFREFGPEESVNVDDFLETLRTRMDGNVDEAWGQIDTRRQGVVTRRNFVRGTRVMGFKGDAVTLFRGLDFSGTGRVRPYEFMYLRQLHAAWQREEYRAPPIRKVGAWAQAEFGGPDSLLQSLGLNSACDGLEVEELEARLLALGYRGGAHRVAAAAARAAGSSFASKELLYLLFSGQPVCPPPAFVKHVPIACRSPTSCHSSQDTWVNRVDDISRTNTSRPSGRRSCFDSPASNFASPSSAKFRSPNSPGFQSPGSGSTHFRSSPGASYPDVTPSSPATARWSISPSRPEWNGDLFKPSEHNTARATRTRTFFSNPDDKPVRKQIRQHLQKLHEARQELGQDTSESGSDGSAMTLTDWSGNHTNQDDEQTDLEDSRQDDYRDEDSAEG